MTHIPLSRTDIRKCRARFGAVPRTTAVSLLHKGAPEEEWLAARRQSPTGGYRLGASELAAVVGVSPHTSPFSLWWAKQESWVRPEPNANMTIGSKLESVIGELWAEAHPDMLLCRPGSALYGHPGVYRWLVCTPDFLAVSVRDDHERAVQTIHVEPVECKSDEGGKGWGAPGSDEVPEHHRIQVYVQCEILGAERGHLMRLSGKRATAYVLPYDDVARLDLGVWLEQGEEFIVSLADGDPPDVDGHKATTEALQTLHTYVDGKKVALTESLISQYLQAHSMHEDAKGLLDEMKNVVRQALGDAQIGVDKDGRGVVKRNVYKRRGYEVGPSMVDELRRIS